jgi:molecular chaperone DnaJ
MEIEQNHYAVLKAHRGLRRSEIAELWHELSRLNHPDAHPGEGHKWTQRFAALSAAWSILGDDERRAAFNGRIDMMHTICYDCDGAGYKRIQKGFASAFKAGCLTCGGCGRLL